MKIYRIALFMVTLLIACMTSITTSQPALASTVLSEVLIQGYQPYRILPGTYANEYWVVLYAKGLALLTEGPPDNWTSTIYLIDNLYDAVGPDVNGRLFCSFYGSNTGSGVKVFDCYSRSVIQTISLGSDYPLTCLTLSPDGTKLYVLGMNWPRVGTWTGGWVETPGHPDQGLIWEIDTATYAVNPETAMVGTLPETVCYAEGAESDKLFVYVVEHQHSDAGRTAWTDVIDVVRGFPRVTRISSGFQPDHPYCNDLIKWSDTEPLIALCNKDLDYKPAYPEYSQGLWIINTETNSVVQRMTICDSEGNKCGVDHAFVSRTQPGIVYLALGFGGTHSEIAVVDYYTGAPIRWIRSGRPFWPEFIYEISDDRLIVTGGETERILIIDPT
jgi:hypothetical protein